MVNSSTKQLHKRLITAVAVEVGDLLTTLLFNIALENREEAAVVLGSKYLLPKVGHTPCICTYADNIDVVCRNTRQVDDTFAALQLARLEFSIWWQQDLEEIRLWAQQYNLEVVGSFLYLSCATEIGIGPPVFIRIPYRSLSAPNARKTSR